MILAKLLLGLLMFFSTDFDAHAMKREIVKKKANFDDKQIIDKAAFFRIEKFTVAGKKMEIDTMTYHGYREWGMAGGHYGVGERSYKQPWDREKTQTQSAWDYPDQGTKITITFLSEFQEVCEVFDASKAEKSIEELATQAYGRLDVEVRPKAIRASRVNDQVDFYDAEHKLVACVPCSRKKKVKRIEDLRDFEAYVNLDELVIIDDCNRCVLF